MVRLGDFLVMLHLRGEWDQCGRGYVFDCFGGCIFVSFVICRNGNVEVTFS